jgi:putative flippase GtrA
MMQLFRYAAVGIVSNVIGYLIYLLITKLGMPPKLAMTVLYGVGVVIGFWGNSKFTFKYRGAQMATGWYYLVAHCIGYLINLAIQIILVDIHGYPHQLAQAIGVCLVAAFLFLAFKYFVFSSTNGTRSGNQ